jgi:7-cyano-7-deazaguanine synthase
MNAVVLLSGGMDSTTALAQAVVDGAVNIVAVSFQYGSRHQLQELASAERVVKYYNRFGFCIERVVVIIPHHIFVGSGSSLIGESDIPDEEYHDPEKETPSSTVVPFRNANMISIATTVAESRGYDKVYVGVHATDAQGFAYPDCTPEFMGAMSAAIYVGTHHKVRLVTPFQWMDKSDIVTLAAKLLAPLHLTWSCYRGGEKQCGHCPTCRERLHAFSEAGFIDPVAYEHGEHQMIMMLKPWPTGD